MADAILPRLARQEIRESLDSFPVVVVTGARQTGKTTICRELSSNDRSYATLDDAETALAARRDPQGLLDQSRVILDEVQREPSLLSAVKIAVDQDRLAGVDAVGRFLLTGSANLLLMRRLPDSLAGRASYINLWPMTRREQRGLGRCGIWSELLATSDHDWLDLVAAQPNEPEDWRTLVVRGGFPEPALRLSRAADRTRWFESYERTYVERDLRDLSQVGSLSDFRLALRAAALRVGQLTNQSSISRDIGLPQPTVRRYLNLLETSFLLVRLPAYLMNRTKRLIKTPKLYWSDTGLALHLAGNPEPQGAHLENLIVHDLLAWRDATMHRTELFHWRTAAGAEVDLVVESKDSLLPIEVKATSRPRTRDARHLFSFRSEYGGAARSGLLLHTGDQIEWIAPGILAAPWWRVL